MNDSDSRLTQQPKSVNSKPNPRRTTHGMLVGGKCPPEYDAWRQMKARCFNKKHSQFENYGGRGITVCKQWMRFQNFISDMGPRPSKHHSLDRIKNNLGYSPNNCRWTIDFVQNNNTRRNRVFRHDGLSLSVSQWARRLRIPVQTLFKRITLGRSVVRILSVCR